jgi:hypothetical protein
MATDVTRLCSSDRTRRAPGPPRLGDSAKSLTVRVVAGQPSPGATLAEPNLKDAYLLAVEGQLPPMPASQPGSTIGGAHGRGLYAGRQARLDRFRTVAADVTLLSQGDGARRGIDIPGIAPG